MTPSTDAAGHAASVRLPDELVGYLAPSAGGTAGSGEDAVALRWSPTAATLSLQSWTMGDLRFCLVEADDSVDARPSRSSRCPGLFLGMCLEGRVTVFQPRRTVTLEPGEFAFYRCTDAGWIAASGRHRWLIVGLGFVEEDTWLPPVDYSCLDHGTHLPASGPLAALLREVAPPPSGMGDEVRRHCAQAIQALVRAVLAVAAGGTGPSPAEDRFARLSQWIDDHLDQHIDAGVIARAHHLSAGHVRRIFARRSTTVSASVRDRRLERLRLDLVDPRHAATTIAVLSERWNLTNAPAVSRTFKDRYGLSPRAYRKAYLPHQGGTARRVYAAPAGPTAAT
ncbi:helix-turn-helix domain-containing protein [Streptomyces sp. NPDC090994]|uniref:helix-turn-helix domain-containing protein n=1 Tax=Streptomyces sp. NPDC090994 TaxID=3365969 RepID=UPI00381766CC